MHTFNHNFLNVFWGIMSNSGPNFSNFFRLKIIMSNVNNTFQRPIYSVEFAMQHAKCLLKHRRYLSLTHTIGCTDVQTIDVSKHILLLFLLRNSFLFFRKERNFDLFWCVLQTVLKVILFSKQYSNCFLKKQK